MNKEEFQKSLKQIIKTTLIEFDPPFNLSIPVNYFRVKGSSINPFYPGDENILSKFQSISEVNPVRWKHPVIIHFNLRGKLTNGKSNFGLPVIVIDNEAIQSLCKTDENLVIRWNKSVLEYYRSFSVDEYITHTKYFIEWFELEKEIVIDSPEYKLIPLLYNDQPENELSKKSITVSKKGGRPKDPDRDKKIKKLCKEYYHLTEKEGLKKSHALKKLKPDYGWSISTMEKYIK